MSSPATVPYGVFLGFVTKNIPDIGFPVTITHVTGAFWGLVALWTATEFYGAELLVTVLAMVYPAWMSFKAEKSGSYPAQWIAYWIIFAFLYMFEFLTFIISSIPIYLTFKMALLLWCMFPTENNGAVVLYNGIMKPALAALDGWVNSIKTPVVEFPKDD